MTPNPTPMPPLQKIADAISKHLAPAYLKKLEQQAKQDKKQGA